MHVPNVCRGGRQVHRGKISGDVVDDDIGDDGSMQMTPAETIRSFGWKATRGGSGEQSRKALPKNLIRPLPYRITKATGSGDLLSQTPVHAGARDVVDYGEGASHEVWQNLDWFGV